MSEESIDYSEHYHVGMRVGIDIPLSSGQVFREWGIIIEMDKDYLQLRLSRDILPNEMRIEVGTIFLLVTGKEGAGLCCRAIVVGDNSRRVVPLRLISEVLIYERREFFRLGTYLPMAWQPCRGMTRREVRERWQDARLFRTWHWSELNEAVPMMKPLPPDQQSRYQQMRDTMKVKFQPLAANISGSGIRLKIGEHFTPGDLIALQFFIPFAKPNTIEVVGEVVWTAPVLTSSAGLSLNYVSMSYQYIDDRDRESIIRLISLEQLQQLQQLRGNLTTPLLPDESLSPAELAANRRRRILITTVVLALLVAAAVWLAPMVADYYARTIGRNVIDKTFEEGVNKYRKGSDKYGY